MVYRDADMAVMACERARTGNYGYDEDYCQDFPDEDVKEPVLISYKDNGALSYGRNLSGGMTVGELINWLSEFEEDAPVAIIRGGQLGKIDDIK